MLKKHKHGQFIEKLPALGIYISEDNATPFRLKS